jgi:hypothetical protein
MTDHSVEAFVEAILTDRPPRQFSAAPDEADVLRLALELRASQAGRTGPDPQFVEELHRRLAATSLHGGVLLPLPDTGSGRTERQRRTSRRPAGRRPRQMVRPRLAALGKAAAVLALVAGSFTAANLAGGTSPAPVAQQAPSAGTVRSGALLTADGLPLGRTYAYGGNPSWVFMDVRTSALSGMYTCELHLADGATVPAGVVVVYHGTGDWAHTVKVQASQIRRATLVTSTGVTVASATFA